MKNFLLGIIFAAIIAAVAFHFVFKDKLQKDHNITEITTEELVKLRTNNSDLVLIDARGQKSISKTGMIKGAINLTANKVKDGDLEKIVPNKKTKLVFYCSNPNCKASKFAAIESKKLGYKNIYEYSAGFDAWNKAGFDITK